MESDILDMQRKLEPLLQAAGMDRRLRGVTWKRLEGGSDRLFFRLSTEGKSFVCLVQDPGPEIESYICIGRFLAEQRIPVPEILASDASAGIVLMEDLGDCHLDKSLEGAPQEEVRKRYNEATDIIVTMQTRVTKAMFEKSFLADRVFSVTELLGETEYFVEQFIEGFCKVDLPEQWQSERKMLAETLSREPLVFMHRDFQSRNIMVHYGRLKIVDFQTAHRGPAIYDIASLLRDPYRPINVSLRMELLRDLHQRLNELGARDDSFDEFYERFILAGIQRNLQALAAFAKLGSRKGKSHFLASIPSGLETLMEGVKEYGKLHAIAELLESIREKIASKKLKG